MREKPRSWDWEQHFRVGPCTVLLAYSVSLLALGLLTPALDSLPEPLATLVQAWGWSLGWVLIATASLAGARFVRSLIRRQPQLQFLLECSIALATYAVLPMPLTMP